MLALDKLDSFEKRAIIADIHGWMIEELHHQDGRHIREITQSRKGSRPCAKHAAPQAESGVMSRICEHVGQGMLKPPRDYRANPRRIAESVIQSAGLDLPVI